MNKFRKKPVVIEAIQYEDTFSCALKIREWTGSVISPVFVNPGECKIETLEGVMNVSEGDWIIKGVNGEFYPCKPDIFEKTYEAVEQPRTDIEEADL
jgi:hypothetical protein